MLDIKMRDQGMNELTVFLKTELGLDVILAQSAEEEMIGLYTTKELISPNIDMVLSVISKNYNKKNYEVHFINMKQHENKYIECYFNNTKEVKELLSLYNEMVKHEEQFKQNVQRLINKQSYEGDLG